MKLGSVLLAAGVVGLGILAIAVVCSRVESKDLQNVSFDVHPDGKSVVFSAVNGDLYSLDIERSEVRKLSETPDIAETFPAFSPDGSLLIYSGSPPDKTGSALYLRSLDSGSVRQLTKGDFWDSASAFSADGKTIVFARGYRHRPYSFGGWTWDQYDLCTVNVDGGEPRRITYKAFNRIPGASFWKKDTAVLFSAKAYPSGECLYTVPLQSGLPMPVPGFTPPPGWKGGGWITQPHRSAEGTKTVFVSDQAKPYSYDVYVMENVDSGTAKSVGALKAGNYNQRPRFTSKGEELFFLAEDWQHSRSFSLWRVRADGSNLVQVANNDLFVNPLGWKKDRR